MITDDEKLRMGAGCVGVALFLFLAAPLHYCMLFGILQRIDAPTWMWVCYWLYIPTAIVVFALGKLCEYFAKEI